MRLIPWGLDFTQPARLVTARGGEHHLQLCIADGFWSRFRGLMLAPPLRAGPCMQGLLLRRCTSVHGCFMRYPVDVVYVSGSDASGAHSVTHTARLRPWGVSVGRRALLVQQDGELSRTLRPRHALEIPVGSIEALGIAPGDQLRLQS